MDEKTIKLMTSSARDGEEFVEKDNWQTPPWFFKQLESRFGPFTLDPCADADNAKCVKYFTEEDDGLIQDWSGHTVFVNPPYSKNASWLKKCWEEGEKADTKVVVLIPARTDTKYWHDYCMKGREIHFVKGRIPFLDHEGKKKAPAPFPSAIIVFESCRSQYIYESYPRVYALEKERKKYEGSF